MLKDYQCDRSGVILFSSCSLTPSTGDKWLSYCCCCCNRYKLFKEIFPNKIGNGGVIPAISIVTLNAKRLTCDMSKKKAT